MILILLKLWKNDITESEEGRFEDFKDNIAGVELLKPITCLGITFSRTCIGEHSHHSLYKCPPCW